MKMPVNLAEILVLRVLEEQSKKRKNICFCDKCMADMIAIALNNLPPRYTVTDRGEAFGKTDILNNQISTDILVQVSKAIDAVAKNPKH